MFAELYDGNKNNIELDKSQQKHHHELYEKSIQKELQQQPQPQQAQQLPSPQTQQQQHQHQTQQQQQQVLPQQAHEQQQLQAQEQHQQQQQEEQLEQNSVVSPLRDTIVHETIDVTTVPASSENNISITNKISPSNAGTNDVTNQVYNREIHPPNSIYGIENLTSKPYEAEQQKPMLPENMHSPRYQNGNHLSSPHHSSPERERRLQRPDTNAAWISPMKSHNYRNPIPPTSPYVDVRDATYSPRDPSYAPRRYVPPLYGNGGRNFVHPNDRSRYGAYPIGSPLMSTLGYPREPLDARYNLHMPTNLNFEEDKFKLSPPSMDDKHIWTKQEVELLLDLYEEHKVKLQDPRVRKTKVWEDIAKQIHEKLDADVNGCQCNQKFRNMKADYQKVVEHNARSGSFRKTCKYFERLEKLLTPVNETEKLKEEVENDTKYFNHVTFANGLHSFANKAGTPNSNGFYEREMSRNSSSPDSGNQNYGNSTGSTNTPSSPEKRPLNHIENASDEASPPPAKIPCNDCSCGAINKKEFIDILKEYLKEQKKREEETINRIQALHKEKIDSVVKFLDLFQELVKKV